MTRDERYYDMRVDQIPVGNWPFPSGDPKWSGLHVRREMDPTKCLDDDGLVMEVSDNGRWGNGIWLAVREHNADEEDPILSVLIPDGAAETLRDVLDMILRRRADSR